MTLLRYHDARRAWEWLQWRLPPQVWFDLQKNLAGPQPNFSDPVIAAGFAEIIDPRTTQQRQEELLTQLLQILKDGP